MAAFQFVTPGGVASGAAFGVTVFAVAPYGNTDPNYQGTITFSTSGSDPGVVLPPDYAFQPTDAGMTPFPGGVTLITPGDQTFSVNWCWIDGRRTRRDRRPVSPFERGIISPSVNSRGSWNG